MKSQPQKSKEGGFVLALVLWALAFSSILIFQIINIGSKTTDDLIRYRIEDRLVDLADGGLSIGMGQSQKWDWYKYTQKLNEDTVEVTVDGETGRLNINTLLQSEEGREVLANLFILFQLNPDDRSMIIEGLSAWVGAAGLERLGPDEYSRYKMAGRIYEPPERNFRSIEEMKFCLGIDRLEKKKPNWREYFTVHGNGKLNVNTAFSESIAAVCAIDQAQSDKFIGKRESLMEGRHGSFPFDKLETFRQVLGLSQARYEKVKHLLDVDSNIRRIESKGSAYGLEKRKTLIVQFKEGTMDTLEVFEG